ncbi:MAG: response regulator transcription factor [Lewinellaceae bacterium]|nr:response regulator transcription factor [Phaeodactylibacter sp.]MCB9035381.1 response regulator transcription factor [Lewinellaceae bacterium]
MVLSCYIIDDEPPAIKVLERYIGQTPQLRLLGSATDAILGMQAVQELHPRLLFLDINMPKLSGIGLVKALAEPPAVIFTTAYPEYALEGFELEAVDYLLKPISFERFLKAVNKSQRLPAVPEAPKTPAVLLLQADRKLYRVPLEEILYLQAYGDYVKVHAAGQLYVPKTTLNQLEEELPAGAFFRIHRSYLVSLARIQYLEGNFVVIGEDKIPVGRSYREGLLRKLQEGG